MGGYYHTNHHLTWKVNGWWIQIEHHLGLDAGKIRPGIIKPDVRHHQSIWGNTGNLRTLLWRFFWSSRSSTTAGRSLPLCHHLARGRDRIMGYHHAIQVGVKPKNIIVFCASRFMHKSGHHPGPVILCRITTRLCTKPVEFLKCHLVWRGMLPKNDSDNMVTTRFVPNHDPIMHKITVCQGHPSCAGFPMHKPICFFLHATPLKWLLQVASILETRRLPKHQTGSQ